MKKRARTTKTASRSKLALTVETIATLRPLPTDRTKEIVGGESSIRCGGQCSFSNACVTN
jgi:hypothetical protein